MKKNHVFMHRSLLALPSWLLVSFAFGVTQVRADDRFNVQALEIEHPGGPVDVSQFSRAGGQTPGIYRVDVWVNDMLKGRQDVTFIALKDQTLSPLFTPAEWQTLGLKTGSIAALRHWPAQKPVEDFATLMPGVVGHFDFSHQKLLITIPQELLDTLARGAVSPELWDEGAPALLLNYNLSGARTWQNAGGSDQNQFLSLRSGANWGGWRLRNYSTWRYSRNIDGQSQQDWDSAYSFLQRDVPVIKGQFIAGESTTPADIFDSFAFRGVQLFSDDNMLPDSLRGFAPVIRGIARSNAQVTIKQSGIVIYQTYVPPGAFSINDLYPTSASGDLDITIRESNGEERHFTQAFSAIPIMQREGRLKYALTLGKYRAYQYGGDEPGFVQGSLIYGLGYGVTLFGGSQMAENYHAANAGMGSMMGDLGSVSLDTTFADSQLTDNHNAGGQAYRLQYAKSVAATGSTLSLAGIRYRGDFYHFSDASNGRQDESNGQPYGRQRGQFRLNLTQTLNHGEWGSLSLSYYQQKYTQTRQRSFGFSYNVNIASIDYALSLTDSQSVDGQNDRQIAFNISIPLSRWLPNARATASMNSAQNGPAFYQTGINGTLLEDNNLSYAVSEGYGSDGQGNSGSASLNYLGSAAQLSGGYNYNQTSHQLNYGWQGAVVGHPHGVTFSQPLMSDVSAIAIVRAPGAAGVKLQNNTGVYTDWRGYAVVNYLSPYKRTRVALDTTSLDENIDIDDNVLSVVPTSGAVVMASFTTRAGSRLLLTLTYNGQPVPFGAEAFVAGDERNRAIVGDNGQVYLSGLAQQGNIQVIWRGGQCQAPFTLQNTQKVTVFQSASVCQ
ncbi:FimD family fimbriae anchoring protein [Rahnella aquatilis CIP 78.65 = ATCC 33071]|uniref:P pilus assembly protein, porin PapC n=1 Tax=Rahnella aquatilis (strain ATCC 33071 / DSM 4594 / JCM 1683 / NBRC 105701 / NCIMB 13365 / CIP 78.65) TaxID=745277 RepID=H2IQZ3_RAHAC|nr:fimbria/pilus outer membrane usher protein [Rahnella aquatilis]AEX53571.1 P pilus assembly protein, porin PapC [Rahnella aquatilis CIP 78.65 = ATCC 33071]KFD03151.1 FimD family fimbriae anchoring protein [Rahnella aquatilis CIP 78.65 = ATCC 33071]